MDDFDQILMHYARITVSFQKVCYRKFYWNKINIFWMTQVAQNNG